MGPFTIHLGRFTTHLLFFGCIDEGERKGVAMLSAKLVNGACVYSFHQVLINLVLGIFVIVHGLYANPGENKTQGSVSCVDENLNSTRMLLTWKNVCRAASRGPSRASPWTRCR